MRLAEPQLPIYEEYAQALYDLPNVLMVSNPAMLAIGVTETFPGLDVLLYHGYSFDYYIATVDEIRNNGGYDRADLVMKFMLRRRHLAPTHASCLYIPFPDHDPLIISKVPDIFATGHLHKVSVSNYRNVTLIGSSCWQGKTAFQEKMGHHPEPCRVPIINLQTREVKILRFGE
jgi:DNA polymerase II small subunit